MAITMTIADIDEIIRREDYNFFRQNRRLPKFIIVSMPIYAQMKTSPMFIHNLDKPCTYMGYNVATIPIAVNYIEVA